MLDDQDTRGEAQQWLASGELSEDEDGPDIALGSAAEVETQDVEAGGDGQQ